MVMFGRWEAPGAHHSHVDYARARPASGEGVYEVFPTTASARERRASLNRARAAREAEEASRYARSPEVDPAPATPPRARPSKAAAPEPPLGAWWDSPRSAAHGLR